MKYKKLNLRQARKEWKKGINIYLYPVYGKDIEPVGGMEISIFTSILKDDSFDGIAFAEYKLGEFYYSGEVVEKNYDKAIELFKQSANRKSFGERAAFKLGNFYEYGEIPLNKDLKEALHWYEIAAKTNKEAQLIVANMYYQGIGTEKNYEKAKIFYENISPKNDINLLKNLANIYELEGNVESAIEYYTRASFQGDKESGVKADKLTKKANDMKKTLDRVNQKIN